MQIASDTYLEKLLYSPLGAKSIEAFLSVKADSGFDYNVYHK